MRLKIKTQNIPKVVSEHFEPQIDLDGFVYPDKKRELYLDLAYYCEKIVCVDVYHYHPNERIDVLIFLKPLPQTIIRKGINWSNSMIKYEVLHWNPKGAF